MIQISIYKMLHTADGTIPLDLSLQVEKDSLLSIYGHSGAGKTTILRILAGLTKAEKLYIEVDGQIWDDSSNKTHIPIQMRSVGFLSQNLNLFPNMTVKENLQFALPKGEHTKVIDELLEITELQNLQNIKPQNLSGGQQQRAALARAIVRKPKLLLLDEPLSALDDEMRFKLQDYILKVHRHYGLTTLMVSHNLPEIFKLSNQVISLKKGKIEKKGKPSEVFSTGKISGKFKLTGEILQIEKSDIIYIVSVLSDNSIVKVIATENEIKDLKIGTKVMVASKAFNPLILKID